MPIDPLNEELLGCPKTAQLFSRLTGENKHHTTFARYMRQGCIAPSGRRIYLESIRLGSRLYTTPDALRRFIAAMSEPAQPETRSKPGEQAQHDHAELEAQRVLDRENI
jgi:hypothetical protein